MADSPEQGPGFHTALALCLLASYAVAVFCRLAVIDLAGPPTSFDITTADGYGWLAAIEGLGILREHVLAKAGHWLVAVGVADSGVLAVYAPVLVGSLAAPLMMYWVYTKSGLAGGIFAGIVGMQLPVLYSRTSFGYFDSDAVIIPLLVLVVVCYEAWFAFVDRKVAQAEGYSPMVGIVTAVLGLGIHLSTYVHIAFSLNAIALVLVSVCLRPRAGVYGLYVLAIALFGVVGLVLCMATYWFLSGNDGPRLALLRWALGHRAASTGVLLVVLGVAAVIAEVTGTVNFLSRLESYVFDAFGKIWSEDTAIVRVAELASLDFTGMLQLLTGNIYLSLLGLAGVAVAIWLDRRVLFLLFPLVLGLLAPVIGSRFVMFGALVIVLAGAIVLARLVSHLSENRAVQVGMLGGLSAFYCFQLFRIYEANPPKAFGEPAVKQVLADFDPRPRRRGCDLMLTSWGRGYLTSYYTRMPTVINGASYPWEAVTAHARMMLADDQASFQRNACAVVASQESFIRKQARHFDCRRVHWESARLFTVVTWEDVRDVSQWLRYGMDGGAAGHAYRLLDQAPVIGNDGTVEVDGERLRLATLDIVTDHGLQTQRYGGSGWHLVTNEPKTNAVLLETGLYNGFFVQAFLGRHPVPTARRDGSLAMASAPVGELCPDR